jgi:voltage-gated potassium channel
MNIAHPSYQLLRRLRVATLALLLVIAGGTAGYYWVSGQRYSFIDCLYMTFITITTIGYGEIVDLSHNPAGRVLTMGIALAGIGTLTYLLSSLTAFIVEGNLSESFRSRKMEKKADFLDDHYIVCGAGQVGAYIVHELRATRRDCILIDTKNEPLEHLFATMPDLVYFHADATDGDVLNAAGLSRAAGLFAATGDDNQNLVIALTARQINPRTTIIARCADMKNVAKLKTVGASAVISPSFIGGLRMASEMIRPTAVSFLDAMLRETDRNLRIEEIAIHEKGKTLGDLGLEQYANTLLLAIREPDGWVYHPKPDHVLGEQSRLVVMTTPQDRQAMERRFNVAS